MSSIETVIVVGVNDVVPNFEIVFAISLIASNVPSIVSYPPAPWIWTSINPGERYIPLASITSLSSQTKGFISLIFPSLIRTDPFSILSRYIILQFFINI